MDVVVKARPVVVTVPPLRSSTTTTPGSVVCSSSTTSNSSIRMGEAVTRRAESRMASRPSMRARAKGISITPSGANSSAKPSASASGITRRRRSSS